MDRIENLQERGLLIPLAIVIAALVLAVAVYATFSKDDRERCQEAGGTWIDKEESWIGNEAFCYSPGGDQ